MLERPACLLEKSTYACVQLSQVMGHWGGVYPSGRQYSDCKPIVKLACVIIRCACCYIATPVWQLAGELSQPTGQLRPLCLT